MTTTADGLASAAWFKSSYSNNQGGECVECADVSRTHSGIAVRDSKTPEGPALLFTTEAFSGFITAVKRNGFTQL